MPSCEPRCLGRSAPRCNTRPVAFLLGVSEEESPTNGLLFQDSLSNQKGGILCLCLMVPAFWVALKGQQKDRAVKNRSNSETNMADSYLLLYGNLSCTFTAGHTKPGQLPRQTVTSPSPTAMQNRAAGKKKLQKGLYTSESWRFLSPTQRGRRFAGRFGKIAILYFYANFLYQFLVSYFSSHHLYANFPGFLEDSGGEKKDRNLA